MADGPRCKRRKQANPKRSSGKSQLLRGRRRARQAGCRRAFHSFSFGSVRRGMAVITAVKAGLLFVFWTGDIQGKLRGPSELPECCALEAVLSLRRSANGGHPALMNYTQTGWMQGRRSRG
ncbi:hypothetical protein PAMA_004696 [Pampus argenteus]